MNIRHSPLKTISFQILSCDRVRVVVSWDEISVNIQKDKSKSMLTYLIPSTFPINVAARAITSAYWIISETLSELLTLKFNISNSKMKVIIWVLEHDSGGQMRYGIVKVSLQCLSPVVILLGVFFFPLSVCLLVAHQPNWNI